MDLMEAPPTSPVGWRLRIGMLLPSSNCVAESEIPRMLPGGVTVHTTRLKLTGGSRADLLAMADHVEDAAQLLVDADVDLIAFHCTAVSTFDPAMERDLRRRIEVATDKPATTTSEALVAALRALRARRIVLVSPYPGEVNRREVAFFAHHGIDVLREQGLNLPGGAAFARVEPAEWHRLTMANRHDQADAYLLSCTTIRTAEVIAALERDLGKPVITSNQALAWHAARKGQITDPISGWVVSHCVV